MPLRNTAFLDRDAARTLSIENTPERGLESERSGEPPPRHDLP